MLQLSTAKSAQRIAQFVECYLSGHLLVCYLLFFVEEKEKKGRLDRMGVTTWGEGKEKPQIFSRCRRAKAARSPFPFYYCFLFLLFFLVHRLFSVTTKKGEGPLRDRLWRTSAPITPAAVNGPVCSPFSDRCTLSSESTGGYNLSHLHSEK
jgi:hypothetical protein